MDLICKCMKFRYFVFVLVAMMLLNSCKNGDVENEESAKKYELFTVATQDYTLNAVYPASIQGEQDIKIIPRVEGYLQGVYVKEGDRVKSGQLLFRIDDVAYRSAVESANANVQMMTATLSRAQLEYNGKKSLHDKGIVSDFELSQAESDLGVAKANLAAAKAALVSARNDLGYTEIRSPSDGVVGRIPYRKGDLVGPSIVEGITLVSDNRQMRVYYSMTESQVMHYLSNYKSLAEAVKQMPELWLQLPNGTTYELPGHVESISGVVDDRTGAVSVCVRFDNPNGLLLSGGTGKIVMSEVREKAIVIPQEATYEIQDKVYVYKVVEGKAVSAIIEVEPQTDGKNYLVVSGLKEGEVIIAKGTGFVQEGVRVIKKEN